MSGAALRLGLRGVRHAPPVCCSAGVTWPRIAALNPQSYARRPRRKPWRQRVTQPSLHPMMDANE